MVRELYCSAFLLVMLVHGMSFAQTKIKAAYGAPSLSVIMIQLDVLREDGKIKDAPPAQTFMDMSFFQTVEKERQASGQK